MEQKLIHVYTHILVYEEPSKPIKSVMKFYAENGDRAEKLARSYVRLMAKDKKGFFKLFPLVQKSK